MSGMTGVQEESDRLAAAILRRCERGGLRIACAESLTGGLLADAFVRIPGASLVFLGSAVTYDIRAKASLLGVDRSLLEREGAVHPQVARQMADGTARLYTQPEDGDVTIGLSTTGVAGPGPDGDKPAGLVYVGFSLPAALSAGAGGAAGHPARRTETRRLMLDGDRASIRHLTVLHVLRELSIFTADIQE